MEKIILVNPYGRSITLGGFGEEFILMSRGDAGGLGVNISTETGYLQRGASVIQKTLGQKTFILTIGVKSGSQAVFKERMNTLSRFFEPEYYYRDSVVPFKMQIQTMGYTTKEMEVFVQKTPTFLNTREDSALYYQRCYVNLLAPIPIWKDVNNTSINLASQIDLLEFPLELSDSFEFSQLVSGGVPVNNLGDVSVPVKITFTGLSTNPIITNETYGESLKLLTTIADGDVVNIDTSYETPSVTITSGGVTTNAFQYIDPANNSLNMTLRRGENLITYTSDDLSVSVATLRYKKSWLSPFSGVIV